MEVLVDTRMTALLVIDVQPTFMPGGGLAVNDGDAIMPVVHKLISEFPIEQCFASKDRHMHGHISFASSYIGLDSMTVLTPESVAEWTGKEIAQHALFSLADLKQYLLYCKFQVLWPDHGVAGTMEAELYPELTESDFMYVLTKGMDPRVDSYSAFMDNSGEPTGLHKVLRDFGIQKLICCGLAYDYCVGFTAINAVNYGFDVLVVKDATRSVGYPETSISDIETKFEISGVQVVNFQDLVF